MAAAMRFDLSMPPAAVLVFDEALMPRRSRKQRPQHPFRALSTLKEGVAMVCANGPGAPSAAVAIEFLAAFGVETVVAVGAAGDLNGSLPTVMHPVVGAVSDEGTSQHYSADLSADAALTDHLTLAADRAPLIALTTDVPFRHTRRRLEHHRARADVVEMECAALFAVAHTFNMRAGSLVVASDDFDGDQWSMRDRSDVNRELKAAVATAITAAGR